MKFICKVTGAHLVGTGRGAPVRNASGVVEVATRGGGFVGVVKLEHLQQVEDWPRELVEGWFVLEGYEDDYLSLRDAPRGYFDPSDLWNGWAKPFLPRDTIDLVFGQNILRAGEQRPTEYDGVDQYEWRGDRLWRIGCEGDDDLEVRSRTVNGLVYHAFGDGFCWDAYTEQEIAARELDDEEERARRS